MTDTFITIPQLRLYCHHGVGEQERRVGNWFVFSLTLHYDATSAITTDKVSAALSYADVVDVVRAEAAEPSRLLENLAGRIHRSLSSHFPQITSGSISITKSLAPTNPPTSATFTLRW